MNQKLRQGEVQILKNNRWKRNPPPEEDDRVFSKEEVNYYSTSRPRRGRGSLKQSNRRDPPQRIRPATAAGGRWQPKDRKPLEEEKDFEAPVFNEHRSELDDQDNEMEVVRTPSESESSSSSSDPSLSESDAEVTPPDLNSIPEPAPRQLTAKEVGRQSDVFIRKIKNKIQFKQDQLLIINEIEEKVDKHFGGDVKRAYKACENGNEDILQQDELDELKRKYLVEQSIEELTIVLNIYTKFHLEEDIPEAGRPQSEVHQPKNKRLPSKEVATQTKKEKEEKVSSWRNESKRGKKEEVEEELEKANMAEKAEKAEEKILPPEPLKPVMVEAETQCDDSTAKFSEGQLELVATLIAASMNQAQISQILSTTQISKGKRGAPGFSRRGQQAQLMTDLALVIRFFSCSYFGSFQPSVENQSTQQLKFQTFGEKVKHIRSELKYLMEPEFGFNSIDNSIFKLPDQADPSQAAANVEKITYVQIRSALRNLAQNEMFSKFSLFPPSTQIQILMMPQSQWFGTTTGQSSSGMASNAMQTPQQSQVYDPYATSAGGAYQGMTPGVMNGQGFQNFMGYQQQQPQYGQLPMQPGMQQPMQLQQQFAMQTMQQLQPTQTFVPLTPQVVDPTDGDYEDEEEEDITSPIHDETSDESEEESDKEAENSPTKKIDSKEADQAQEEIAEMPPINTEEEESHEHQPAEAEKQEGELENETVAHPGAEADDVEMDNEATSGEAKLEEEQELPASGVDPEVSAQGQVLDEQTHYEPEPALTADQEGPSETPQPELPIHEDHASEERKSEVNRQPSDEPEEEEEFLDHEQHPESFIKDEYPEAELADSYHGHDDHDRESQNSGITDYYPEDSDEVEAVDYGDLRKVKCEYQPEPVQEDPVPTQEEELLEYYPDEDSDDSEETPEEVVAETSKPISFEEGPSKASAVISNEPETTAVQETPDEEEFYYDESEGEPETLIEQIKASVTAEVGGVYTKEQAEQNKPSLVDSQKQQSPPHQQEPTEAPNSKQHEEEDVQSPPRQAEPVKEEESPKQPSEQPSSEQPSPPEAKQEALEEAKAEPQEKKASPVKELPKKIEPKINSWDQSDSDDDYYSASESSEEEKELPSQQPNPSKKPLAKRASATYDDDALVEDSYDSEDDADVQTGLAFLQRQVEKNNKGSKPERNEYKVKKKVWTPIQYSGARGSGNNYAGSSGGHRGSRGGRGRGNAPRYQPSDSTSSYYQGPSTPSYQGQHRPRQGSEYGSGRGGRGFRGKPPQGSYYRNKGEHANAKIGGGTGSSMEHDS